MPICARCSEENLGKANFCQNCGEPLETAPKGRREVRKVVTLLFTDVRGSTAMGEVLDPEPLRRVMTRYFESMRAVIERHGGTVEKFVGDAVLAVFGIPVLHDDDALRAVRAAAEMREVLGALNKEFERDSGVTLEVRFGINTGEVVAGALLLGDEFVAGDPVNIAARLEQNAPVGEILLGSSTYQLIRNAVEVEKIPALQLKGKSEPVVAYRVISISESAPAFARRLDSPLVGREHELELLRRAFERAARESSCHLFTLLGSAGIGKSRLVDEFLREVAASARVVEGRCLAYGEGITYWPLAEVIKDAAGLQESTSTAEIESRLMELLAASGDAGRVSALLLQLLGLERGDATTEELAWASRRMLETMAQISPLIVVIDDVHWAEPALLDTIGYIADWSREAPILFMCVARPELLDERSEWGGGKMNATSLLIEPLTPSESDRLLSTLLGDARLTEEVNRAVSRAAEGNPLFVEQMLEMLIDDGHLVSGAGGWTLTGPIDGLKIPPTIDALISARLDRLGEEERQMIERASVVGNTFSARAVRFLSPDGSKEMVLEHLMALVRKELLRPGEGGSEEGTFRFRHILLRDAAYDSISKAERADMHLRFADWIRHLESVETVGVEEILAHHLSQAHRYKKDLGTAQEQLAVIAAEAAKHYESSGQRALARSDFPAAAKLLRRGSELVSGQVECGNFILPLAEILFNQGCAEEALEHLERIRTTDDELMNARAEVVRILILTSTGDKTEARSAQVVAERTLPIFEAADDLRWVARSYSLLTHAYNLTGETSKQIAAAEKAIGAAQAAGDGLVETQARVWLGVAHSHGFTPADEVLSFLDEQREFAAGALGFQAFLLAVQGLMKALIGKFDEARVDVRRSIRMTEELGLTFLSDLRRGTLAWVEMIAGEFAESCRQLEDLRERLERHGDNLYLSTNLAVMAECLCELGRHGEAEAAALRSRDISSPDDVASQAGWRGALARVLAARGERAEAERLLAEGAQILLTTETFYRADFSVQAAKVHTTLGALDDTRRCFAEARRDYQRKGATACVASVDALVAALPDPATAT